MMCDRLPSKRAECLNIEERSEILNHRDGTSQQQHYFVPLQVKYKEAYEKTKGKVIGIKSVSDDSQMAHSALATKLQSDRHYKKEYEDTKTKYR